MPSYNCSGDLITCLSSFEKIAELKMNYKQDLVKEKNVSIKLKNATVRQILEELCKQANITYHLGIHNDILLVAKPVSIFVHGIIIDGESSERIADAIITFDSADELIYTDKNGYFRAYLSVDSALFTVVSSGYQLVSYMVHVTDNQLFVIKMSKVASFEPVNIRVQDSAYIQSKPFDEIFPSENLIPSLGGETDALNNLKMLTGIQNVSFGDPGLIVRGGGPDQNFILVDGVPVYNTFHLLGLYSIFNSSSVNDIKVYKDAFPSRYSSRLSSVIDVSLINGNKQKHEVEADIGIVSSGLALNGPIVKDKISYSISARRTYADLLMYPVQRFLDRNSVQKSNTALWYYDIFGKIHYQVNKNNDIKLTAYNGGDQLNFNTQLKLKDSLSTNETTKGALGWRNHLAGLQWNSILSDKVLMTFQNAYSSYLVEFSDEYSIEQSSSLNGTQSNYQNGLSEFRSSLDFDIFFNKKNYLQTGLGVVNYNFKPFSRNYIKTTRFGSYDTSLLSSSIKSQEYFIYAEDKLYFEGGNVTLGVRAAHFKSDSSAYTRIQPRVLIIQNLSKKYQLRFGLSTVDQFVHLVPNNNLGLPLDIWLPVTSEISPLSVTQLSSKIYAKYSKWQWQGSVFSKLYNNIIEHKNGANLLANENWEEGLSSGNGRAYGIEFSARTKIKKWNLYGGYTFCRSKRTVEDVNDGAEYFSKYDRPHSINILTEYAINDASKLMISFSFASGNPVTLPSARYVTLINGQEVIVEEFDKINNFRMPATHHLDVSYQKVRKHKHFESTLIVGVYNIYNQLNPFMVYIGVNETVEPTIKIRSYLPMMPMLKYTIRI